MATTPADDDLVLTVNGTAMSGWTDVRVTRSIERCPSDFDIQLTDLYPGQAADVVAQDGDPCTIALGSDLAITGYIDTIETNEEPEEHSIRVTGRGKCQDLVDASAEWPGGQISGTPLEIAQKLADAYKISVSQLSGGSGSDQMGHAASIPQFNLNLGETAYEIIERACRAAQLLCYEDEKGNLVLANAGTGAMASGFQEGVNILGAKSRFSRAERFSEYDCFLNSMAPLVETGDANNLLAQAFDKDVKRNRKHFIVADAGDGGMQLAQARANWDANRRWGRGNMITVTGDSWRDSAGTLWTPNRTAPVNAPGVKWTQSQRRPGAPLIGTVTYLRDAKGTRAEVTLMPREAFLPEPILLQPELADLNQQPTTGAPASP